MKIDRFAFVFLLPFLTHPFMSQVDMTSTAQRSGVLSLTIAESQPFVPKSVKIGTQEWTTENLDVSKFRNGEPIMEANTYLAWEKACIEGKPAWCYYKNDAVKYKSMGKLYNFWAVIDSRKLAPEGWHVPNDAEWLVLAEQLGGVDEAGNSMKAVNGWKGDGNGNNKSGFAAIPAGYRSHEGPAYYGGPFFEAGEAGYWWSTTRYLVDNSFCRTLSAGKSSLEKKSFVMTAGLSVRILKDGE